MYQSFKTPVYNLKHVVVTSSHYKSQEPRAQALAEQTIEKLAGFKLKVTKDIKGDLPLAKVAADAQLVICIGGDGTLLATARRLVGVSIPTMGVNLGKLGFLAEHSADDLLAYLAGQTPQDWSLSAKMMLKVTLEESSREALTRYALNDIIVSQGIMTRLLSIDMAVDNHHAIQYRADGLVVSTPVGSTAYSLSLGGPILTQGMRAFVITPIAPHALTNRPIVIEPPSQVSFSVHGDFEQLALVVDGQERLDLVAGHKFIISMAPTDFVLISSGKRSYFDILREKLSWGARVQGS